MATITANSANKHLADFSTGQKRRAAKARDEFIDDSRSEAASVASFATSSHFSSVLKRGPFNADVSAVQQSCYDEGNAELQAQTEEERARQRKEEKEERMRQFAEKTKKNAQAKLAQEQAEKQNKAMEQQVKEREKALKAKDYARKQREIIKQQTEAKKAASQEAVPVV